MKRRIATICTSVVIVAISGCGTMMVLLGDNTKYSISGKVESNVASDSGGIEGVLVAVDCPGIENSIYQDKKVFTNSDGNYKLTGFWPLEGCKIKFTHDQYTSLTIHIDETHLLHHQELSLIYRVDARLNPK